MLSPAQQLSSTEQTMIKTVDAENSNAIKLLEQLVNINSGTMNLQGVRAVKDIMQPQLEALGFKTRWVPMETVTQRAGDLVAEHPCQKTNGCGKKILLIGHMDTVFEPESPFQKFEILPGSNGNVATGPGVNDMKGGLVVMLTALKAMKTAGALDGADITIVLSGDEERTGKPLELARKDMIEAGKQSDVSLEFETAVRIDGLDYGSLARRGSISWKIEAKGETGHSSQIFGSGKGYGAIYELTRILDAFRQQLPERGATYSVGLLLGGVTTKLNPAETGGEATGKGNIIPAQAIAMGDLRTLSNEQSDRIKKKMEAIVSQHLSKTTATITFSESYPSMPTTEGGRALLRMLNGVNASLGFPAMPELDPMRRGAGDIAFVAPYTDGLVGVGANGDGAHAVGETIFLDSIAKQAKRNALLMYRLTLLDSQKKMVELFPAQ
jgi:glutamate carboxypeptidase